ncbi:MAG: DedA family protein [Lachnospiraceae bacterium]
MDIQELSRYFAEYGASFIFLIVLLEYMNLPGFPAGVIMPLAGIWAARGNIGFAFVMILSVAAGLLGSWILYFLGRFGGERFFRFYVKKFPKQRELIEKNLEVIRKKGAYGVFVSKLIPMLRTLISIPAGIVGLGFARYTVSSVLGVFLWNLAFVGAGYFMGDTVWQLLGQLG